MKPNICHINLAKGFRGGERQTLLLVQALSEKSIQTIVTRKGSDLSYKAKKMEGITVIELTKPFLFHIPRLKSQSIVHAHESKAAHLAYFLNHFYRIPYIITRRVTKPPKNGFFFKAVHSRASQVVAISNPVKSILDTVHKEFNTRVIFSSFSKLPVDEGNVRRLKQKYKNKFIVGHVGALVNKDKGQIHIIHTAKRLLTRYPDIHFLFLGDGRDKDWFHKEAEGFTNMEFKGFKTNIGDYYATFDLFLFPSLSEGLGSSILDAFYFHLPVIASSTGGIPDIITHGENGLLIPPGDEDQLYRQILTLYKDRIQAARLGRQANASLASFDIQNTSCQYLELYKMYHLDPDRKKL
jgi:glycosyltransferase involved in cell wall biosynthesis